MITKVLLTLLVVALAYLYIKWRMGQNKRRPASAEPAEGHTPVKLTALVFILVSFTLTVGFFGYRWVDGNQLLKITLISPQSSKPLHYEVRKSELHERSFTTTDGLMIRLGAQDRLQIETLSD